MGDSIRTAAKAAFSLFVLFLVVRSAGPARIWAVITGIDVRFFLLGLGIALGSILLSAKKLHVLLAGKGEELPYLTVARYYCIGMFFNSLLPSTIGGDVVKMYKLFGDTEKREEAAAAVFMDRYTGLVALLTIAAVATAVAPVPLPRQIYVAVYGAVAAAALLTGLFAWKPVDRFVPSAAPAAVHRAVAKLGTVQEAVTGYSRQPVTVGVALTLSIAFHALLATVNIALATAAGMQVPWPYFFVFIPIAAVILFLPISIGGLGVREAVYTYLFGLAGASAATAVSVSLLFQGIFVASASVGGLVYAAEGYGD